jgi:hypothetical protein
MSKEIDTMPDDVLYHVCTLVLRKKISLKATTEWLRANGYRSAKRTWPHQMLVKAFDRGLLGLPRRENYELAARIQRTSGTLCRVSGVADDDETAFEAVAELAADQVLHLIRQVHAAGQEIHPARDEVHIGLAAGGTSRAFASHLARKLQKERDLPVLWLHTLTSGFFVDNPDSAPVVSLGQFNRIEPRPKFVVLFSTPLVSLTQAKKVRELPFTREAFEAAGGLDIVVTSVSVARHAHSLFRLALMQEDPGRAKERIDKLNEKGWAGDIMWQPYSKEGQLIECDVRAVSVVDFHDLVRLSNAPAKYVVCIAGLCADCDSSKLEAVIPLMRCANTSRPFNHLVTTQSTAYGICRKLGW